MTYEEAKAAQNAIEAELKHYQSVLAAFPRGPMNLTPDAVRALPEWQAAKNGCDSAFARLRKFNAFFVPTFKAELRAERTAPKGAR